MPLHYVVAPLFFSCHVYPGVISFSSVHLSFLLFPFLSLSPLLFARNLSSIVPVHPVLSGLFLNALPMLLLAPLVQSEPSAAPEGVSCESASSTSLRVSWRPPPIESQNGELAGYELRYQRVSGAGSRGQGQEVKGLPIRALQGQTVVEGLDKWSWYNITVAATTSEGAGPNSQAVLCRTDEDGKSETRT